MNVISLLSTEKIFFIPFLELEPAELVSEILSNSSSIHLNRLQAAKLTGRINNQYLPNKPNISGLKLTTDERELFIHNKYEKATMTSILKPTWAKYYHLEGFFDEQSYRVWMNAYLKWAKEGFKHDEQKSFKLEQKARWLEYSQLMAKRKTIDNKLKEITNGLKERYIVFKS